MVVWLLEKLPDYCYKEVEKKNHKVFADVIDALGTNNIKSAIKLNSSVVPDNLIETNLKKYSEVYFSFLETGKFTATELQLLDEMAKQCPINGGSAVYNSRTLLGYATNTVVDYPDECGSGNPEKRINEINRQSVNDGLNFSLYPNPNDGDMQIEYKLEESEKGLLMIYDLTGKKVLEFILTEGKHSQRVDGNILKEGIYYYVVSINGETRKARELVIIK